MIDWDFETGRLRVPTAIYRTRRWRIVLTLIVFVGLMATWLYYMNLDREDTRKRDIVQSDILSTEFRADSIFEANDIWTFRGTYRDVGTSVLVSFGPIDGVPIDGAVIMGMVMFADEQDWHSTGQMAAGDVPSALARNAVVVCQQLSLCQELAVTLEKVAVGTPP